MRRSDKRPDQVAFYRLNIILHYFSSLQLTHFFCGFFGHGRTNDSNPQNMMPRMTDPEFAERQTG
jgi:hypothetical protein